MLSAEDYVQTGFSWEGDAAEEWAEVTEVAGVEAWVRESAEMMEAEEVKGSVWNSGILACPSARLVEYRCCY
jgi:hypothetical protein